MFAKAYGGTTLGVDGLIIDVEVDAGAGFPQFDIVGLPDTAVRESRERVRTAIKNSGLKLKAEKVTVNLAPADIRKESSGLDLPIAMGLLAAHNIFPKEKLSQTIFIAELSLEGECRPVQGILPMVISSKAHGFQRVFVSCANANEALLVDGIEVYAVNCLSEIVSFFRGENQLVPASPSAGEQQEVGMQDDFADVQGQFAAKRALEIAAAGGHNLLMVGIPGSGKSMLARRLNSILPDLTREEALEVTKIYSIAGLLPHAGGLITKRPFRSPHHTASQAAMIGGGTVPRPGEVTLAHHGVLFLDELPEFSKSTLEVLRQPLEDREIVVSRVHASLKFPASFMLIAAMNPCPCGYHGDETGAHRCECTPTEIKRYTRKISGPLLDRIDIHIRVPRVAYKDLSSRDKAEPSAVIRARVSAAREIQHHRLAAYGRFCNAQMNHALIQKLCPLDAQAQQLLGMAFEKLHLSARSYDRIIKVARTIADLNGKKDITSSEIGEAIQLRNDIGLNFE